MTPPSQGGRGHRAKLVLIVLFGLFTIAQGVLPGQTDDADKDQVRCLRHSDTAPGPTDEHGLLADGHRSQPVPDQQQQACSSGAPPLRGQTYSMQTPSLRGNTAEADPGPAPLSEQRQKRQPGPRVPCYTEATPPCPGQLTWESTWYTPCQAGTLCRGSKPVSHKVEVSIRGLALDMSSMLARVRRPGRGIPGLSHGHIYGARVPMRWLPWVGWTL